MNLFFCCLFVCLQNYQYLIYQKKRYINEKKVNPMELVLTAFIMFSLKISATCFSSPNEKLWHQPISGKHHNNCKRGFGPDNCTPVVTQGSFGGMYGRPTSGFGLKDMGRGNLPDDYMLNIGSGINHGQAICSKQTILQWNYTYLVHVLREFESCHTRFGSHGFQGGQVLPHSEYIRRVIYDIFYDCQYLIKSCFFHKYYHAFRCKDYETCFYIIRRCLKVCDVVKEYSYAITNACSTSKLYGTDIYSSVSSCIYRPNLSNCRKERICSADFICDVKAVICLDLSERIDLINLFIHHHFTSRFEQSLLHKHVNAFIIIYKQIYVRSNSLDHIITAIVLTKLYGDLNFGPCDISVLSNLTSWLVKYYNGGLQREAQFICKVGMGCTY